MRAAIARAVFLLSGPRYSEALLAFDCRPGLRTARTFCTVRATYSTQWETVRRDERVANALLRTYGRNRRSAPSAVRALDGGGGAQQNPSWGAARGITFNDFGQAKESDSGEEFRSMPRRNYPTTRSKWDDCLRVITQICITAVEFFAIKFRKAYWS